VRPYTRITGVLLLLAAFGAAACSSGDSGHDRAAYVKVLGGSSEGFTKEEGDCAAGAVVDAVGVDKLEAANAYDKIQKKPDGNLQDFGIQLSDDQSSKLFTGLNKCKDLRTFFESELTNQGLSADLASCVMDKIDDATFQKMIITSFAKGDDALNADQSLSSAFTDAGTQCAASGIGG
jgi:hypothetical protein